MVKQILVKDFDHAVSYSLSKPPASVTFQRHHAMAIPILSFMPPIYWTEVYHERHMGIGTSLLIARGLAIW